MMQCKVAELAGIASRDRAKAESFAKHFGIAKAYGSYDELLSDPEIEAIYNPLPNHLHAEWTIRAASRGKHVLCEKPLTLNVAEARRVREARDEYKVKVGEAFMVRTHPQWLRAREMIRGGRIGKLRSAMGWFGYFNVDPANVRNMADIGGGALLDIGCYPITMSRFVFGEEPTRVIACVERDPSFHTDRLTSGILEFPEGQSAFTVCTQLVYAQRMIFFGTEGRLDVEIPYNPPTDKPARVLVDNGKDLYANGSTVVETIPESNQFTIQADLFSEAIVNNSEVACTVEDAICNMAVIDALFRSEKSGKWETPERL